MGFFLNKGTLDIMSDAELDYYIEQSQTNLDGLNRRIKVVTDNLDAMLVEREWRKE